MRPRIRRLLLALSATIMLLLAGVAAGVGWLVATESGLRRAIAFAESLEAVEIRVSGARGRLIGPLRVEAIDIRNPRAAIRIEGLVVSGVEPAALLAGTVAIGELRVRDARVRIHARTGPPKPPGFLPRWLTMRIDRTAVASLEVESPGGAVLRLAGVAGGMTVTRPRIEVEGARADAGTWAVAGASGRLRAREPLALEGIAGWSAGRNRELAGIARVAGDLDRMVVRAQLAVPGRGDAELELTALTGDFRWQGRARIEALDLRRWIDAPPFGPLRATLDVEGDRIRYAAAGVVHGAGLPASGVEVEAVAERDRDAVELPRLAMKAPGLLDVEGAGAIRLGETPAWELSARWSAFAWPLAGRPVLRSPGGTLDASGWREFAFRIAGAFAPRDAPSARGELSGRLTAEALLVERSEWRALGGTIAATGSLGRGAPRRWTLAGRARDLDPSVLEARAQGRLSFSFAASGAGIDEDAHWSVSVDGLSGRFRGQAAAGGGTVRRRPGVMEFEQVAITVGPARLALDGAIGAGRELVASLGADDLSSLHRDLAGGIDAALTVRDRLVTLAFTGHDLGWKDHRAVVFSADARLDLDDRETSWLRLRTSGLTLAGQTLADTRLSLDGRMESHDVLFRIGIGGNAIELRGEGRYAGRTFRWRMQEVAATGPQADPWRLETPAQLQLAAGDASLAPLCFVHEARRICLEGRWQRGGPWSAGARVDALPLEHLTLEVPGEPEYSGLLFVDATATGGAGGPWLADVRVEVRDGTLRYLSASGKERSVALGRSVATVRSTAEAHRLELRVIDAEQTRLSATLAATRVDGRPLAELPVAGEITGATRQLALLPLFLEDVDEAAGRLSLQLAVAGRVGAPALRGQARLEEGSLDFYRTNLKLRDLQAQIDLLEQAIAVDVSANAGEGSLRVDGRLAWRERRPEGQLRLQGERLLIADVPEARVLASPDLRFALEGRRIAVTGNVAIPEARIDPAEIAGAVLASPDERIVGPGAAPGAGEPFEVETDVRLVLGEAVHLDAYGLSGRITGSVRAWSAPGEAALASGELAVQDGEYRAYTRELEVERGRLLFTGGPVTDPGVDLRASRQVPGHVVGVIVRGRLRRPQLTLFSEPSLPQAQIASLLIVGQSIDVLQGEDRERLATNSAGLAAQGGALLASQLGRHVGLDEVGLSQGGEDTALVLGKFLSPRLYVSYGISLVDEINTLKLRYTIGDRWVLSAESGREAAAEIQYRIEH